MIYFWWVTFWFFGLVPTTYPVSNGGEDPCIAALVGVNGYVHSCEATFVYACSYGQENCHPF